MSEDSKPLLFIDTVNEINKSKKENIKQKQPVFLNRVEDIKAMLYYKFDILCEIKTKNTLYEGVVKTVNNESLELIIDNEIISIPISIIEDINILKL